MNIFESLTPTPSPTAIWAKKMRSSPQQLLLVLAVAAASADEITELVALPPADGASSTSQVLKWVKVTYPSAVTTCSDVTMEDATGSPELGAWDGLDLGRCLTEQ